MRIYVITTLFCVLLTSCSSSTKVNKYTAPDYDIVTLSHYPDCEYKVLGNVEAVDGMDSSEYYKKSPLASVSISRSFKGDRQRALSKLKAKASKLGADAIAITGYKEREQSVTITTGRSVPLSKYLYRAQAIKHNCSSADSINVRNEKPVKYLEDGSINMGTSYKNQIVFTFSPENKNKVTNKTQLSETNSFIDGRVFGFALGQAKQEVLASLGSPSAVINYQNERQAYLYGRRHVFYFNTKQLIGYEYADWLLPPQFSNDFEFHDVFDQLDWRLEDKIKIGASLGDVAKVLNKDIQPDKGGVVSFKQGDVKTKLAFLSQKDMYDDDKVHYTLNAVSIFNKDEETVSWQQLNKKKPQEGHIDFNNETSGSLIARTRQEVVNKLGQPDLIIYKAYSKDIWYYGQNLQLKFLNDAVFKFSLESNAEIDVIDNCNNCLYLGQSVEKLPANVIQEIENKMYVFHNRDYEYLIHLEEVKGTPSVNRIEAILSL